MSGRRCHGCWSDDGLDPRAHLARVGGTKCGMYVGLMERARHYTAKLRRRGKPPIERPQEPLAVYPRAAEPNRAADRHALK